MKVSGSYQSVTKGVSQQAPADRLEGQHGEAINVLFDPVRGVVRRNGFVVESDQYVAIGENTDPSDAMADAMGFREFSYRDGGQDFDILYRSRAQIGDSPAHLDPLIVHSKGDNPNWVPVVRDPGDTMAAAIVPLGFSAVTSIGSYVLLAANGVVPWQTVSNQHTGPFSGIGAIWVRGGSNNRTFTVKLRRRSDQATFTVVYTTPQASYPGILDLTQIPAGAVGSPFEQAFYNVYQAQYERAVNEWTTMASQAIIPSNIAQEIAQRFIDQGMTGWNYRGSHLIIDDVDWIEVDDGGNGDYIRSVLTDVKSADDLTDIHYLGKVIKVQPSSSTDDAYYLKAFPKSPGNPDPIQTVIWREDAGQIQTPAYIVSIGRMVNGTFYWASDPGYLQTLILNEEGLSITVPGYVASTAGDTTSMRPPAFYNKPITMLTTFQDRLLIGSGSVINASEAGDYFNFYRTTMLTIPDNDPVEFTAVGTESDTLRKAVTYDKNLTLYGDKFHYAINGKVPLTASNPQMNTQFALAGSAEAQPVGVGKYVYVLKYDSQLAASRLLQVQAGVYQDSPDLNDVGKQLRDYVNGSPASMVALASPSMVFVRTEHFMRSAGAFPVARPWGLYVFQYLDGDDGSRVQESWGAWEWSTLLGIPIGLTDAGTGDSVYIYTIAFGTDHNGDRARGIYAMKASARTDPTGLPYLDGMRTAGAAASSGLMTSAITPAAKESVFTAAGAAYSFAPTPNVLDSTRWVVPEHPHYTLGDAPPETLDTHRWEGTIGNLAQFVTEFPSTPTDNVWTGTQFASYIDLTNPFVRDRDGKLKDGVLNLGSLYVTVTRTAGIRARVADHDGNYPQEQDGFRDTYYRIKYEVPVFVGRDSKDVQVRLEAIDWLPMTINQIAWKGNWFGTR